MFHHLLSGASVLIKMLHCSRSIGAGQEPLCFVQCMGASPPTEFTALISLTAGAVVARMGQSKRFSIAAYACSFLLRLLSTLQVMMIIVLGTLLCIG